MELITANLAPIIRIILRYGVGYVLGAEIGGAMAADPQLVTLIAIAVGALVEGVYAYAKRKGWAT